MLLLIISSLFKPKYLLYILEEISTKNQYAFIAKTILDIEPNKLQSLSLQLYEKFIEVNNLFSIIKNELQMELESLNKKKK